jgi:hypothetical protein
MARQVGINKAGDPGKKRRPVRNGGQDKKEENKPGRRPALGTAAWLAIGPVNARNEWYGINAGHLGILPRIFS